MSSTGLKYHSDPTPHSVKVSVDPKTGDFTYSPSFVHVKRGDTITFSTGDEKQHFSVMFKELSPGDKIALNDSNPPVSATLTINPDTPYGVYHYAAAISVEQLVFLDSGCGDVGVEN